mgnify:CR=1 FL=1
MKVNIELRDELVKEAMQLSKAKSKKELIEQALENYIKDLRCKSLLELRGKVTFWEGYPDEMRAE